MSTVTLSQAVRSNLLSLQNTASLLDTTQTRLATGNKVNSALDNPTSYFTASSLNARASDLGNLLDSVSNAVQTIQAANDGITSITKLVESAQATAQQAQQASATITANINGTTTGNVDLSDNTAASTTGTLALGADISAANVGSTGVASGDATSTIASAADTLSITVGNKTLNITFATSGGNTGAGTGTLGIDTSNVATDTVGEVTAYIQTQLQALGGDATNATVGIVGGVVKVTSGGTANKALTVADGTTGSGGFGFGLVDGTTEDTNTAISGLAGKSLTVQVGSATTNLTFGLGTAGVSNKTELLNLLGSTATVTGGGDLKITAANTTDAITISGNGATSLGVASAKATSSVVQALTGSIDVSVNGGTATSVALGSLNSAQDVADAFSAAGVNATINSSTGFLTFTAKNGTDTFSLTNGASGTVSEVGTNLVSGGTISPVLGTPNPVRAALVTQYNGLLDQIDQLTKDASYNGNNLLSGSSTQLQVVFNETGTSNLTITGKDASSSGLGLNQLASTAFDTNTGITATLGTLKTAQDTLRADASSFGSNLSIVQTRQDFTKALINTLQTGASNLTLADSNEEAANLLALQTRQSLSTKALSLASQSDQNVLRLLQ